MDKVTTTGSDVAAGEPVFDIHVHAWHGLCQLTTPIAANCRKDSGEPNDTLSLTLIEGGGVQVVLGLPVFSADERERLDLPPYWQATDDVGTRWTATFNDTDESAIRFETLNGLKQLTTHSRRAEITWNPEAPAWARMLQFDLLELPESLRPYFHQLLITMDKLRRDLHSKREAARLATGDFMNASVALDEANGSLKQLFAAAAKVGECVTEFDSLGLNLACTIAPQPANGAGQATPNDTPPERSANRRDHIGTRTLQRWIKQADCQATTTPRRHLDRADYLAVVRQLTVEDIGRMPAVERTAVATRLDIRLTGSPKPEAIVRRIHAAFKSLE
jgi:hypothetical protein